MEQIKKEKLNLTLKENYNYHFEVPEDGVYFIEIIANARSWWQNILGFKSFLRDDDLAVKIDGMGFPKLNGRVGIFDGEAAWNGNNLKSLSKINLIMTNLNKGNHTLEFLADQNPILESVAIFKIGGAEINYIPENNSAQDGNGRQWITIIPMNVGVKSLKIMASAKVYPESRDEDDLKIILDGKIQVNETDKAHKNWHWCGRVLRGEEKEFNQQLNWKDRLHYIELWADRMPTLAGIKLTMDYGGESMKKGRIVLYKDIAESSYANLRKRHDTESDIITQLEDGSRVEIVEEIVKGENVQNYSNIWHKIRHQENEGYVLSSFVEIEGQEREIIVEKIRARAKAHGVGENYAIALAGCESRYKPYAVSFSEAMGIFQLTSIARNDLRERFNFQISEEESFTADKNIEAGIIYLKWLFSIYNGVQDEYKKITAAWNVGASLIPVEGAIDFGKISNETKKQETQNLVNNVEKNRAGNNNWKYILSAVLIIFLVLSSLNFYFYKNKNNPAIKAMASEYPKQGLIISDTEFKFNNPYPGIKSIFANSESPRPTEWYTNIMIEYNDGRIDKKVYSGFLDNAYLFNIISFDKELVLTRQEGKQILTSVLFYNQKSESLEDIKFIDLDGRENEDLCCSYVILKPFQNGVQYELGARYLLGEYESVYRYNFSEPPGIFFEKEVRKIEKNLSKT